VKRHLNTLFVTRQGSYLRKQGESVTVELDGEVRLRMPLLALSGIVCFGNVLCSPFLLGACAGGDTTVSLLSCNGRFLARVVGPTSGNVLLRREQYRRADDRGQSATVARTLVAVKIANSRTVLQRSLRDHPAEGEHDPRPEAVRELERLAGQLGRGYDLDGIRGIEGNAARAYFAVFDRLIRHDDESFRFGGRSRRPPTDAVNALLSFVYTLLLHDVLAAIESVGLDPQVGFLHRDRPGRPGLALDLMEELRAPLADRLVLSLINRRQVAAGGFSREESGGVVMDDATRKTVLVAWQERKQDELTHPFLEESTTVGLLFHLQALLFARFLRGDLDAYPAFVAR
jgi:CRISPR-associated protein Cas1